MTGANLRKIIASTRHLLLDFDGPVCAVFAGTPAPHVAKQLRDSLTAAGFTVPDDAEHQDDRLEVFRAVARTSDDAAILAQHVLTALELRAVKTAQPTRGSADLIVTAYRTGRTVTIVSSNSGAAITAYLADHRLTGYIRAVVARDGDNQPRRDHDGTARRTGHRVAELSRSWIKAAPAAPLAPASALGLCLWEARPARAGPHDAEDTQIKAAHTACRPVRRTVIVLGSRSSRSRLPRQGRLRRR